MTMTIFEPRESTGHIRDVALPTAIPQVAGHRTSVSRKGRNQLRRAKLRPFSSAICVLPQAGLCLVQETDSNSDAVILAANETALLHPRDTDYRHAVAVLVETS
jgi:hypothetical protein